MTHLNRVEGAILGAIATVHADVDVDIKSLWFGLGTACLGVVAAHNPNTLGRADFGTDTTGCTPIMSRRMGIVIIVDNQRGNKTKTFGNCKLFLRIFDSP